MLFNSFEFIFLFLPITLLIYFQIGKRGYYKIAIAWLVVASLFFYGWWNPSYLGLLSFSILFNYFVGSILSQPITILINKRLLLTLGIAANVAGIGYFKYANFFTSNVNALLDTVFNLNTIILPLAISFFTFEQIAYLVDVYRGETKEHSFLNYCLFVTFFPRLLAGPIIRHQEVMPQFAKKSIYQFNSEDMAVGLTTFLLGLSKKVLLADSIVVYATPVFAAAADGVHLTFFEAWTGALAYSLQLYFDFSGYSDMAIGASRMFGIKLPLNFNSPYKAVSIIDFWRRWHITLSNFLRDYLYISLGGNRKGQLRRHTNLMITMLLGGLWHGAGWTFVFWGGLHGTYLIVNHQWNSLRRSLGHDLKKSHWWSRCLSILVTFLAVVVSWVFFRAENMETAIAMCYAMVGTNGFSLASSLPIDKKVVLLMLLCVWLLPNTQQWMGQHNPALNHQPGAENTSGWGKSLWQKLQWQPTSFNVFLVSVMAFIAIIKVLSVTKSEFLYFNF